MNEDKHDKFHGHLAPAPGGKCLDPDCNGNWYVFRTRDGKVVFKCNSCILSAPLGLTREKIERPWWF